MLSKVFYVGAVLISICYICWLINTDGEIEFTCRSIDILIKNIGIGLIYRRDCD